jgi:hypothetical protein
MHVVSLIGREGFFFLIMVVTIFGPGEEWQGHDPRDILGKRQLIFVLSQQWVSDTYNDNSWLTEIR